ncbi:MAG: V-type ATP synthase subunit D [Nitrospiria bacterium]
MERPTATRTGLVALRRAIGVTQRGLDLLRGKRDALVREFFAVMKQVVTGREAMDAAMREAMDRLTVASGLEGRSALVAAALRAEGGMSVNVTERNVWGVRIPDVLIPPRSRRAAARSATLVASPHIEVAARAFDRALDLVLAGVSPHLRLKRLGMEIKRTTRRINALNEVILPTLFHQVREIRLALDERDREELIRTKRFRVREEAGG